MSAERNWEGEQQLRYDSENRRKADVMTILRSPGDYYNEFFERLTALTGRIIGHSEYTMAYHTKQFEDYSLYAATMFDVDMVMKRHIEQFPIDCESAYAMGKRLASSIHQN